MDDAARERVRHYAGIAETLQGESDRAMVVLAGAFSRPFGPLPRNMCLAATRGITIVDEGMRSVNRVTGE
jgi:hypothetical protein